MDWIRDFDAEIQNALNAKAHGKEAQARVYARRAAGIVIREHFQRTGQFRHKSSAYDLLQELLSQPGLAMPARQAAEYLVLRVTEEFKLPVEVDLIAQARALAESLLPGADQVYHPDSTL